MTLGKLTPVASKIVADYAASPGGFLRLANLSSPTLPYNPSHLF